MPPTDKNQMTYLQRRLAEEQAKAASSSCLVRAVHRDFAEAYQKKIEVIGRGSADA
ncbi:hypothetical protein Q4F19_20485 [Sphingomonas sp. BIUV-7]|uniref:Uncharacterized protein n=1 Tax=Sphingomonas natans TaxID=3063330 RepID=A0ABT8YFZ5_9SPHN|nr:hypothetical protein [Sphingomonas sp. BIUV-7]MDO6416774.1 hypothetical protein [Sphingomonas sp. BIUV-7]